MNKRNQMNNTPNNPPGPDPPKDEDLYDYWISTSPQFGCADPVGFARAVLERWGR